MAGGGVAPGTPVIDFAETKSRGPIIAFYASICVWFLSQSPGEPMLSLWRVVAGVIGVALVLAGAAAGTVAGGVLGYLVSLV